MMSVTVHSEYFSKLYIHSALLSYHYRKITHKYSNTKWFIRQKI